MATQNSTQFYTSMTASGPVTKVREGSRVKPLDAVPSAQTVSAKNEFNNAQQANKIQAFNAAEKNHINRNYAAEMLPAMQKPRTVENVSNVATMQAGRVDKTALPEYAQYANDDVHQMASVYTATPGVRDNVDYSTLIRELSLQPATKENQAMMRNFLSSRNAKIAAGGEAMAQYANDEVTALAKGYLNQYVPEDLNTDAIYDKADALAERNYNEMERSLAQQQRLQMQNQMKVYEAQRRAADLAYARQSRGMENLLAEQGIGRGLGAAPSSGYSETARLGALANYSNDINQSYQQQAEASRALMAEFEQRRMQALSERNAQLMKNYSDRVAQMNADRDYGFNAWREGRSFGNDDRRLDNESLIAKEQAKNLEAATVRQNIENDWYPKVTQSDIAYKDALTKGAIEDATGKWIDNKYADERNKFENALLQKEYNTYDPEMRYDYDAVWGPEGSVAKAKQGAAASAGSAVNGSNYASAPLSAATPFTPLGASFDSGASLVPYDPNATETSKVTSSKSTSKKGTSFNLKEAAASYTPSGAEERAMNVTIRDALSDEGIKKAKENQKKFGAEQKTVDAPTTSNSGKSSGSGSSSAPTIAYDKDGNPYIK
ncbi:MAG: hypothetical protein IJD83_00455 [Clostridia bacterium]|nr:hypothetical protein [Clostridia bacterium]